MTALRTFILLLVLLIGFILGLSAMAQMLLR